MSARITMDREINHLTVIECPFDRQIMYVGISDSGHLGFLDWRYSTFGMQDEDGYIFFVTKTVYCSTKHGLRRKECH